MKRIRKRHNKKRLQQTPKNTSNAKSILENEDDDQIEEQASQLYGKEAILQGLRSGNHADQEMICISLSNLPEQIELEILQASIDERVLELLVAGLKESANATLIQLHMHAISNLLNIESYQRSQPTYQQQQQIPFSKIFLERNLLNNLYDLLGMLTANLERPLLTEAQKKESHLLLGECFNFISNMVQTFEDTHLTVLTDSQLGQNILIIAFEFLKNGLCQKEVLAVFAVLTECNKRISNLLVVQQELLQSLCLKITTNSTPLAVQELICQMIFNVLCEADSLQNINLEPFAQALSIFLKNTLSINIFEELNNLKLIAGSGGLLQSGNTPLDQQQQQQQQSSEINQPNEDEETNLPAETAEDKMEKKVMECYKIWMDSAETVQSCLGIMVNLFEMESEEDLIEEEAVGSDCEEEEETKIEESDIKISNKEFSAHPFKQALIKHLFSIEFFQILIEKQQILDTKTMDFFTDYGQESIDIFQQCASINEFGLSALNNFVINYSHLLTQEQYIQFLMHVWTQLKQKCEILTLPQYTQVYEVETLSNLVISEEKLFLLLIKKISMDKVQQILSTEILSLFTHFANIVGGVVKEEMILVYLDIVAYRFHPKIKINKQENEAVIDALLPRLFDSNPMISAQVLNVIYDVYSEEDHDDIFVKKGLIGILKQGRDVMQSKMGEFKKTLPKDNYEFLKETQVNLKRFIKYKEQNIPNLK